MSDVTQNPPSGAIESPFTLTTNTADPAERDGASDPLTTANANNRTLRHDSVVDLEGVGNVNTGSGATAFENYTLLDGLRVGNGNLGLKPGGGLGLQVPAGSGADLLGGSLNYASGDLRQLTPADPLVLDLNADGVKLTDYGSAPVLFDTDNDATGSKEQTGWVSAQDGIVVHDLNNNGVIDGIRETLSEYYGGAAGSGAKPFANGFAALKSLDSSNDNVFNSADAAWSSLRVWVDANHDGKSFVDVNGNGVFDAGDTSELKTFAELGITQINLTSTSQSGLVRDGNEVLASGTFVMSGQAQPLEALAANFLSNPNGHTFTVSGSGEIVTTEGGNGAAATSAYVSTSTTGEAIDVAAKGVNNAYGGSGNDTLTGDGNNNWLAGGPGSETFFAGGGDDVLLIDAADLETNIHAGAGTDIVQVVGDGGVTLNLAAAEVEIAQGGRGADVFIGGGRSSVFVRGGEGDDILIGGAANDALSGEDGNDLIDGGQGNDVIRGHRGSDVLMGAAGDDLIEGGQDDDRLLGGAGNDVLTGGQGDDALDGGDGVDVAQYSGSYADYRITRTSDGLWISDTVSGRDGTDFLANVEKLNFRDVSLVDHTLANPLPVKDVVTRDAAGNLLSRTQAFTIARSQLLGNDIDYQGNSLVITALSNMQGGIASVTASGDVLFTPTAGFTGLMGFKYTISDSEGHAAGTVVDLGTGQTAAMKAAVFLRTADLPSDGLVTDQWYLTDTNVIPVWKDYTGKGVSIGQFEPGGPFSVTKEILDYRHPDLQSNIDPVWLANPTNLAGAGSEEKFSTHATLVAGVMVAAKNGEGAVGVAYDAKVGGHWIDNNGLDLNALKKMAQYDVANNSWTAHPSFVANFDNNPNLRNAFEYAAANGREGLGTVIVMAGGNGRADGDNANYLSTSNNRFSITTGAINANTDLGTLEIGQAPFSNPGASILVAAPGSNIASTSRLIENDNGSVFGSSYDVVQGTSFATPIVSGIVALMLEANPKLGYRDVQQILAISAKQFADTSTDWHYNHARNWNGGAMHVSHDYGFGEVDARAAVRLAETWATRQTWANEARLSAPVSSGTLSLAIPDNSAIGVSSTLTVSNAPLRVEHAEVTVNLTHQNAGDLILKLVSPDGTESILADRPGKAPGSSESVDRGDASFNGSQDLSFTFTTTHDWAESANGEWMLKVIDAAGGSYGTLTSWSLNLYGSIDNGSDTYFYTNEYAQLAASGRNVLNDSDGGEDTINAAAVSTGSTIDLSAGTATIAGASVTIQSAAVIENAIGGEGADSLTGNALDNKLQGGRGGDALSGGAGWDILWGGKGNDTLTGGAGTDAFVIDKDPGAEDIVTDFEVGIDRIVLSAFGNVTGNNVSLAAEGQNTRIALGDGQSVLMWGVTPGSLGANQFLSAKGGLGASDLEGLVWRFGTDDPDPERSWGSGDGIFWAGDGGEQVFGGSGRDRIFGGAGDDLLYGENSPTQTGGGDFMSGEDGDDDLYGRSGNDSLRGGAGLDLLDGGEGDDTLYLEGDEGLVGFSGFSGGVSLLGDGTVIGSPTLSGASFNGSAVSGGSGNDRFVVVEDTTATASQGYLRNIITDFDPASATEKIDLSQVRAVRAFADLQFGTITTVASGTSESYLRVWFGPQAQGMQYITLKNVSAGQLTADDFIFWDGLLPQERVANPLISGTSANNSLTGDAGGNSLDGGAGADTMTGRTGDDTYVVDNADDVVIELPGGGFDTVRSSVTFALPADVENLVLTGAASIDATGNDQSNRITGNGGSNRLDGRGGSDTMLGGAGDDTYVVDAGTDSVVENESEGADSVRSSVSYTLGHHVENLTLTGIGAINATGNALANRLIGNANDNRLDGAQGTDTIEGGVGDDLAFGGAGDDVLRGEAGQDRLAGGAGDDIVDGGIDDDVVVYSDGRDRLDGGEGEDTADFSEFGFAVNVYLPRSEAWTRDSGSILAGGAWRQIADVYGIEDIVGTSRDDFLTGYVGTNRIDGGAGNDVLDGGPDSDVVNGGAGDDRLGYSDGLDTLDGGTGIDTADFSAFGFAVQVNLPNEYAWTRDGDSMTGSAPWRQIGVVRNVENIIGTAKNDVLTGFRDGNHIDGGEGDDTVTGGVGNDVLVYSGGKDVFDGDLGVDVLDFSGFGSAVFVHLAHAYGYTTDSTSMATGTWRRIADIYSVDNITGTAFSDVLTGYVGTNRIDGGGGNDVLDGGLDSDLVNGGAGDDSLVYSNGLDTLDGGTGTDTADFSAFGFAVLVDLPNEYAWTRDTDSMTTTGTWRQIGVVRNIENIIGTARNDVLTGFRDGNRIDGGGGDDTVTGGVGNDVLAYSAGKDILDGAAGVDTLDFSAFGFAVQADLRYEYAWTLDSDSMSGTGTWRQIGVLHNVENIVGTAKDDVLFGFRDGNRIDGGAGNDTVTGGVGDDVLIYSGGQDVFDGAGGVDTLDFSGFGAAVFVHLAHAYAWTTDSTSMSTGAWRKLADVYNVEDIVGTALDDQLTGYVGADRLSGGNGNDLLDGGLDADVLEGGAGADRFHYGTSAEGGDTITDFATGSGGDVLDLRDLLVNYSAGSSNAASFVRFTQSAAHTIVQVDADGIGGDFEDLVALENTAGLLLNDMLAQGNLLLGA